MEIKNCPVCNNSNFSNHLESKDFSVSKESFMIVRCNECNFHFTNPRPSDEDLENLYDWIDEGWKWMKNGRRVLSLPEEVHHWGTVYE